MRRLVVITDEEPEVKNLWSNWEFSAGRIEGNLLTVKLRDGSVLEIEALDTQLVADMVYSHEPSSEIVKGRLGIKRVSHKKVEKKPGDAKDDLVKALRTLLDEIDE